MTNMTLNVESHINPTIITVKIPQHVCVMIIHIYNINCVYVVILLWRHASKYRVTIHAMLYISCIMHMSHIYATYACV